MTTSLLDTRSNKERFFDEHTDTTANQKLLKETIKDMKSRDEFGYDKHTKTLFAKKNFIAKKKDSQQAHFFFGHHYCEIFISNKHDIAVWKVCSRPIV